LEIWPFGVGWAGTRARPAANARHHRLRPCRLVVDLADGNGEQAEFSSETTSLHRPDAGKRCPVLPRRLSSSAILVIAAQRSATGGHNPNPAARTTAAERGPSRHDRHDGNEKRLFGGQRRS